MARGSEPHADVELVTGAALRDRLRQLPPDRRQGLLRSVRRGEPVAHRPDAALAVSVARRQQRTAQSTWFVVPLLTFVLWAVAELSVAVVVVATVVAGYVATLVLARSVRAERSNRGHLVRDEGRPPDTAAGTPGRSDDTRPAPRHGHLPRRR